MESGSTTNPTALDQRIALRYALAPMTAAETAGYLKHLWDFVNPPPHLSAVRIEQDQNGDGSIDAGADEVIGDSAWVTTRDRETFLKNVRVLRNRPGAPAMRLPLRIELRFSEMVRNVSVALGRDSRAGPERDH